MLPKKYFNELTKSEISKLRGGPKHNFRYFVGISANLESDVFNEVIYAKLRNQRASQKTPISRPEGYEPFQTVYGTVEFCIASMTISVPRLVLAAGRDGSKRTYTKWERLPAAILNPPAATDRFEVLRYEAADFEVRHRIRLHAAKSPARLELVLSLMAFGRYSPISSNLDERFEAHLSLRRPEFLRDLLALLDLPEEDPQPSAPVIARAA